MGCDQQFFVGLVDATNPGFPSYFFDQTEVRAIRKVAYHSPLQWSVSGCSADAVRIGAPLLSPVDPLVPMA
jgi:hypothetical protein